MYKYYGTSQNKEWKPTFYNSRMVDKNNETYENKTGYFLQEKE